MTHVDDFLCVGDRESLSWFFGCIVEKYLVKKIMVGGEAGDVRETRYLGRRLAWTEKGIEWETDDRHAKILLEEWNLKGAKPVNTPMSDDDKKHTEYEDELSRDECHMYRRSAARINYMSQDRSDLSVAAKECARDMSRPTKDSMMKIKRVIRYLRGHPRMVNVFAWQKGESYIDIHTDSDWGGCIKTRRSTSGGIIQRGRHTLAHWSSMQNTVALSSAEAELNAIVKGLSQGIGLGQLYAGLNIPVSLRLSTDSSAARGIVLRRGSGKVKHLEVRQLWIQEKFRNGTAECRKIPRHLNNADFLTHAWTVSEGKLAFKRLGLVSRPVPLAQAEGGC